MVETISCHYVMKRVATRRRVRVAAAAVAGTKMTVSIKSRVRGGGSGSRLSSITREARAGRGEAD